ncbi:16S rRNA (cytidine(1402)-2'-O)-methyltransferase [Thiovibrio frasassiensis]|uniref:Ribosomal RNA small subunit methyltransferase I n=1 Tax=Thiovibrio frasassiensis TaxID=2984131 RepID=A0A9X4RNB0_9BACT|nr:16S rRNA (cytidine(1402)-2'-O)-methyltransferase [Thiovibrio frasassiensis]MDG4477065.1 16S rRNA (cytidine(1402)-2'-O)-methyltransferase [Thiovibrio frasassiensis]
MKQVKGKEPQAKAASPSKGGTLFVVATPIGNLEDITLRALRILKEVDLIAAEDTRHTRKLLTHFDIHTPLLSYYKENEASRSQEIVARLLSGAQVALVSDAGTPGISDPGGILVKSAHEQGVSVVPIPGVSALATILSVAGLTEPSHLFLAFLPSKGSERRKLLRGLKNEVHPIVFYESPRRITASLGDCLGELGERRALIGRELTKIHEEIVSAPLSDLLADFKGRESIKGEFVVLIEGLRATGTQRPDNLDDLLRWYRAQDGVSLKDAVANIAKDLDLSRSEVYQKALAVWKEQG